MARLARHQYIATRANKRIAGFFLGQLQSVRVNTKMDYTHRTYLKTLDYQIGRCRALLIITSLFFFSFAFSANAYLLPITLTLALDDL